jgi:serine/threonine protein kinase
MYELHVADPDHFIKPLAFLYGNQIHSNKTSSNDDDAHAYADCVAIAMERGSCNLREYCGDGNMLGVLVLSDITRHMLDAVCVATRKGFVLLDIKLENFVRVTGNPDRYKAIDFESVVKIGDDISNAQVAVTYGYVSPEIAKIYLSRVPGTPTNKLVVARADAASSVFSLGVICFELFNNLTPFWRTCGLSRESEFINFSAELTNNDVRTLIKKTFCQPEYYKLAKFLENSLECYPNMRISASNLRKSSLFGENVSMDVRDIHENMSVITSKLASVDENLSELTNAVRVEMVAHFDKMNANITGLTGSLIGSIGLSIEATPVLQQLLTLTKQFGEQFQTTENKDEIISNVARWQLEVVAHANRATSESMSQQFNELISKLRDL